MTDSTPKNGAAEAPPKAKPDTKARKGFSHPALRAMGIPRLRVPSRNWLIFWAVTGSIAGMIVYDKQERKKVRQLWKDRVSFLAEKHMEPLEVPRKVTIYMAPPPGDYIDVTMKHFQNYIKPLLTASATDFEIRRSSQQGELRYRVAEEIRNKRREVSGVETTSLDPEGDEVDQKIHSKLQYDNTGGVICVGRGAYKEYMNGLHEGWFGPLEPPQDMVTIDEKGVQKVETVDEAAASFPDREADLRDIEGYPDKEKDKKSDGGEVVEAGKSLDGGDGSTAKVGGDEDKDEEGEGEEKKKKVPKPYTPLAEWEDLPTSDEFARFPSNEIAQPMAAITHPHIMGFFNTPIRMYRFFTQRRLADQICREAAAVVLGETRAATSADVDNCKQEEEDWGRKWKQAGIDKKSEWMADFKVDNRILEHVRFYELPRSFEGEEEK